MFSAGEPYIPLHEEAVVAVGSAGYEDLVQPISDTTVADQWVIPASVYAGFTGPFDVRIPAGGDPSDVSITIGEHKHCASPPLPAPEVLEGVAHVQYSIQPTEPNSCLQWWAVDIFTDSEGLVRVIRREIWEP